MTQIFDLPANSLIQSDRRIEISSETISLTEKGNTQSMRLRDIRHVRYWMLRAQGHEFSGFDFTGADGTVLNLHNRVLFGEAGEREARQLNDEFVLAVLKAFDEARPDLQLELGNRGWVRWSLFAIGVASLAFSIAALWLALEQGRGERLWAAAMPIGLLLLIGGALSWSNRPWQKKLKVFPRDLLSETIEKPN